MSDDDPFERIGDEPEEESDPFGRLAPDTDDGDGDGPEPDSTDEEAAGGNGEQGRNPFERANRPRDRAGDGDAGETGDRRAPFAELERARDADEAPFEDLESVFEDRGVEEMDPDAVWDRLRSSPEPGADSDEPAYADVPKHRYCEQCRFFSAPPDISCSHEGTEILEFLDTETVRVVDCPVVAEREALGQRE